MVATSHQGSFSGNVPQHYRATTYPQHGQGIASNQSISASRFDLKTIGLIAGFLGTLLLLFSVLYLITNDSSDEVATLPGVSEIQSPEIITPDKAPVLAVPVDESAKAQQEVGPVVSNFAATGELPIRTSMVARATAFDNVAMQEFTMAEMPTDPAQNSWLRAGAAAPVTRAGIGQTLTKVANFRTWCSFSHFSYNDPVVFPGQENVAHLHMFMGNTLADHNSTADSLQNSGGSSCDGGPLNRSAYWTPALLDGEGNARIPRFNFVYYKSFDTGNASPAIEEAESFPTGLRFLSTAHSTVAGQAGSDIDWWCGPITNNMDSKTTHYQTIPNNCGGNLLGMRVRFPFCWNGELESTDPFKNDHMVFPVGNYEASVCPSTHQRRIPHIEYQMIFNTGGSDISKWHLSSDVNPTTGELAEGGSTSHGDWFNGWNTTINNSINRDCHRALGECHQGIVQSNGTSLVAHNRPYLSGPQMMPLSELSKLCPGDTDNNSIDISYCTNRG